MVEAGFKSLTFKLNLNSKVRKPICIGVSAFYTRLDGVSAFYTKLWIEYTGIALKPSISTLKSLD